MLNGCGNTFLEKNVNLNSSKNSLCQTQNSFKQHETLSVGIP